MAFTPATVLEQVEALYIGYFGRAGEPGGVQYWVDQIQAGRTFAQVAAAFSVQAEAKAQHPFLANPDLVSPDAFVESLYSQLLGRASDASGKAYWVAQATAAANNPFALGLLVAQFISGAQGDDILVLQNKIDVAETFTGKLAAKGITGVDSNGQVTAATDAAATDVISGVTKEASSVTAANAKIDAYVNGTGANPGTTFTLKVDTGEQIVGTAQNDTINAIVSAVAGQSTFNTFDSVDGAGGTDTFNIIRQGVVGFDANATVKNVEIYNLSSDTNAAGAIDISKFAGATQFWQITNADAVTNAGSVGIGYRNTKIDAADTISTKAATLSVALDNVATTSTITTIDNSTTGDTLTKVSVGGTTADFGTLAVDVATSATKVATVDLSISGTKTSVITVTGDAAVLTTINGSASTANLQINTTGVAYTALDTISTGSGKDVVTANLFKTISTGAGADTINVNTAAVVTSATVDAGAGQDIINFTLDNTTQKHALTLTGGADGDTFNALVTAQGNIVGTTNAELLNNLVTITDFTDANDVLNINDAVAFVAGGARTAQNVVDNAVAAAAPTDLAGALTAVNSVIAAGDYGSFNFQGNTYVYVDVNNGGAITGGDLLIQLTGVHTLNATNFIA